MNFVLTAVWEGLQPGDMITCTFPRFPSGAHPPFVHPEAPISLTAKYMSLADWVPHRAGSETLITSTQLKIAAAEARREPRMSVGVGWNWGLTLYGLLGFPEHV